MADLAGLTLHIQVLAGRNLSPKDKGLFKKAATSDPFVKVFNSKTELGSTKACRRTLNPEWTDEKFKLDMGPEDAVLFMAQNGGIILFFLVYDEDVFSDHDPMGTVVIQVKPHTLKNGPVADWHKVEKGFGSYYCESASGDIKVELSIELHRMLYVSRGMQANFSKVTRLRVGLAWEVENDQQADLDCSCVAVNRRGEVLMSETVYYGNLTSSNLAIRHSGDETTGEAMGDDEKIYLELDKIPQNVLALYLILTVAANDAIRGSANLTLQDVRSARVTFMDMSTSMGICQVIPSKFGANTALFLLRVARSEEHETGWAMTPIEETNPVARDFGTLIPEIRGYTRDLVPDVDIDPTERIAIMKKGGTIRVQDYVSGGQVPRQVSFGLAWDVTDGVEVDLDASAVMLDANLRRVDVVYFGHLHSKDGSIRHSGDEQTGEQAGDDEVISINVADVAERTKYIGFVVNSFSEQELDDVKGASCHLFDPRTGVDIARYSMTNAKELDGYTALLMACLYREGNGDWLLRIIGEPKMGKVARNNVKDLQQNIREAAEVGPDPVPDNEFILTEMPDVYTEIDEEDAKSIPEEEYDTYLNAKLEGARTFDPDAAVIGPDGKRVKPSYG